MLQMAEIFEALKFITTTVQSNNWSEKDHRPDL